MAIKLRGKNGIIKDKGKDEHNNQIRKERMDRVRVSRYSRRSSRGGENGYPRTKERMIKIHNN